MLGEKLLGMFALYFSNYMVTVDFGMTETKRKHMFELALDYIFHLGADTLYSESTRSF